VEGTVGRNVGRDHASSGSKNRSTSTAAAGSSASAGGAAAGGIGVRDGQQAYYGMLNKQGGIQGHKIKLTALDDQYSPAVAQKQMRELVQQDKVFAISGGEGTPNFLGVVPYLEREKVPAVAPYAPSSDLGNMKAPHVYMATVDYVKEFQILTQFVLDKDKANPPKKLSLVGVAGNVGDNAKEGMDKALVGKNIPVRYFPETPGTSDLTPLATQLKQENADWVFLIITNTDTGQLVQAMQRIGYTPKFITWAGMADDAYIKEFGPISQGLYMALETADLNSTNPKMKEFVQQFTSATGKAPSKFDELGWSQAQLTAEGLRRAKALTRSCLEAALQSVSNLAGGCDAGFRRAVEDGTIAGPRLLVSNRPGSQTGGHADFRRPTESGDPLACCSQVGMRSVVADGPDEVRRATRENLRTGADHIKVMASGGAMSPADELDTTQYTVPELRAAVEESAAVGTYVLAHAYSGVAIRNCIEAGVRCIEHGNLIDEETARAMAAADMYLVPTLSTYELLYRKGADYGIPRRNLDKIGLAQEKALEGLSVAHAAGVTIASGSDLLGPLAAYKHRELELKAEVLSPLEVLVATTRTNARARRGAGHHDRRPRPLRGAGERRGGRGGPLRPPAGEHRCARHQAGGDGRRVRPLRGRGRRADRAHPRGAERRGARGTPLRAQGGRPRPRHRGHPQRGAGRRGHRGTRQLPHRGGRRPDAPLWYGAVPDAGHLPAHRGVVDSDPRNDLRALLDPILVLRRGRPQSKEGRTA